MAKSPEAQWWAEDAARVNNLGTVARALGVTIKVDAEQPTLNPDGSLAEESPGEEDGDDEEDPLVRFSEALNSFCPTGAGGGVDPSCSGTASTLHEAISAHITDSKNVSSEHREILRKAAKETPTKAKELHRIFSKRPNFRKGDVIDLGPTSFTRTDITTGKPAGQIGWKSTDKALAKIESPQHGIDVDYRGHETFTGGMYSTENETIVAGRYRVKGVRMVTEPGTFPKYGYKVPQYILEEVGGTTKQPLTSNAADQPRDAAGRFAAVEEHVEKNVYGSSHSKIVQDTGLKLKHVKEAVAQLVSEGKAEEKHGLVYPRADRVGSGGGGVSRDAGSGSGAGAASSAREGAGGLLPGASRAAAPEPLPERAGPLVTPARGEAPTQPRVATGLFGGTTSSPGSSSSAESRVGKVASAFLADKGSKYNLVDVADLSKATGHAHEEVLDTVRYMVGRGLLYTQAYEGRHGLSPEQQAVRAAQVKYTGDISDPQAHIGYVSATDEGKLRAHAVHNAEAGDGRWVTLESGQHVYVSGEAVHPSGPPEEKRDVGKVTDLSHMDVLNAVADLRNAWHYKEPMQVLEQVGPVFERGGVKWREGGNCKLDTGFVTIHSGSAGKTLDDVRGLTAHEMMHGSFEKVLQKYREEREKIGREPADTRSGVKMKMDGSVYPEFEKEVPTFSRMYKFEDDTPPAQFQKDDGVTDYSKAYWRDYGEGKCTFHIAVHETLAEIAKHHEQTGAIIGSKLYRDYYKAVRDEYRVLTGSQKARRGVGVTKNTAGDPQFQNHEMYLDADMKPTTADRATYLRWWKADGTNGWATRADSESPTVNANPLDTFSEALNAFCPTGAGGGVDPSCSSSTSQENPHGPPQGNWVAPSVLPGPNRGALPPAREWRDPPLPTKREGAKAGGVSAVAGMTNTHLGDLAEHVLGKSGGYTSLLPEGQRQNPLDTRWDSSDQGFEVKAVSTQASEYKSAPKKEEVASKLAYAAQYGYKANLLIAVVDIEAKQIHTYMRTGTVVGSLYKHGKVNSHDFVHLGTHSFDKDDVEATRPATERKGGKS